MRTLAIILSLFASALFADVKAVIDGPAEARPGDLVVLSGQQSTGDGYRWVSPAGVQTLTCSELELAFAVGTPGRYTFMLIAADTEANIDYTSWTVTIAPDPGSKPPDPEPGQPEEPEQPTDPPPALERLRTASRDGANSLADPATAKTLSAAIRSVCQVIDAECNAMQCPTTGEAVRRMSASIEGALAQRRGGSLAKNWLDGWRRPINTALAALGPVTSKQYITAMRAIATGLDESVRDAGG